MLIGCCGWSEARAKYIADFPAIELQSTFYEPPSLALARKWREAAPQPFEFCMKAWQIITHRASSPTYRRLKSKLSEAEYGEVGAFQDTEQVHLAWERTAAVARILEARVILFQCPASLQPDLENIAAFRRFFRRIDRGASELAWEPRGEWPSSLVEELCTEFNLLHCVDPFHAKPIPGRTSYWRLHGIKGYGHRYSDEEFSELEGMLERAEREGCGPSHLFFNNIWMKDDAHRLQRRLHDRGNESIS